jgi:hypothetical protein
MSKNSKQKKIAKQKAKLRLNKALKTEQHSTNQANFATTHNKRGSSLATSGKIALAICIALNYIARASADDLHDNWGNTTFETNDINKIDFSVQFDPSVFPNINATTSQILQKCGNLIHVVQPNWWNDVSIDWLSLHKFCNAGPFKTQAEAFIGLSQYVVNNLGNVTISDDIWNCLNEAINPNCQQNFFTDWAAGYQALFITGLAVGTCCIVGLGYSVTKSLSRIWSQRSGYETISEPKSNSEVNSKSINSP